MNQRSVIYIILSAILLYLYYKRGGIALFVAFVVVVAGTLFAGASSREGMKGKGGNTDKECAKMGFTAPNIEIRDDELGESLEKEMKKIKKVADKYWPYDARGETNDETDKTNLHEFIGVYSKKLKENKLSNEDSQGVDRFIEFGKDIYFRVYNQDEKTREKITLKPSQLPKGYMKKFFIPGGNQILKILEDVSKSDELKGKGSKKLATYLICLSTHWIAILKKIDSLATGKPVGSDKNTSKKDDGDEGGDDEEEKPKKKKNTKATKKKKSKKDDEADEAEDE